MTNNHFNTSTLIICFSIHSQKIQFNYKKIYNLTLILMDLNEIIFSHFIDIHSYETSCSYK